MPWTFNSERGILYTPSGAVMAWGYSGCQEYKNRPESEDMHDHGPIPRGVWEMATATDHPKLGETVIALTPKPETKTYGRSGFYIHGDNPGHRGDSSRGCLILPRFARERMNESDDHILTVE